MIFENLQPHCAAIIGRRGSGKTVYVLNLLENEFYKKFDYIVIISPTAKYDKAFKEREFIKKCTVLDPGDKDLDTILKILKDKYKNVGDTLFILDDLAFDKSIKSKKPALEELAFISRHLRISIWIISQKYNSINKSFRDQLSWLAIFYCKDKDSFRNALYENNVVPCDKIDQINETLKIKDHLKLIIRNDIPIMYKIE